MTETMTETKKRLLRECEAMLQYVSGRGIQKDLPKDGSLAIFDLVEEDRMATDMSSILALHQSLSRLVAPAFPETIERLYFHQLRADEGGWQIWRRIAPLSAVVALLGVVIALALALWLILANGWFGLSAALDYLMGECRNPIGETALAAERTVAHESICKELRRESLLPLYLFFGIVGALGASYSSIYDSFAYIRDGRYDLRLASTYYVRIILGAFSGILLAEPLANYLESGAFSSTLLAFMGGFGAQLVYDLLNKIVDSIANMFRPERRKERMAIMEEAEQNARKAMIEDENLRRNDLAKVIEAAEGIQDPSTRAETMRRSIMRMMTGGGQIGGPVATSEPQSAALAELAAKVAPHLPEPPQEGVNPVPGLVAGAVSALKSGLGTARAGELARAAILAADRFDATQRLRWHQIAYDALPDDPLLLIADAGPGDLGDGPIGAALAAVDAGSPPPGGGADALFEMVKDRFADRAAFDAALPGWIADTAKRLLARDIETLILPELKDGATAAAIIAALESLSGNDAARGAVQTLEILGDAIKATSARDAARTALTDAIGRALAKGASS